VEWRIERSAAAICIGPEAAMGFPNVDFMELIGIR
jgi:hypothetical protein